MDNLINFIVAAVMAGTPLLFGTVGEIICEKAGHLNLGVEGIMSIGACAGFMVGYSTDSFLMAVIASFLGGVAASLIYAVLTVTFMANQNVTGLTLTIFGVGLANLIGVYMLEVSEHGTLKLGENVTAAIGNMHIEGLSDIPVIGELLFSYNPFVYIAVAIAIAASYYLYKTKTGLSVRAIGENPASADAAGIPVTLYKYINIMLGGGICGIGGAYCAMIINGGVWISDNVGGLGWISVALVIFAAWKPNLAIFGSFLFGMMRVLKYYIPTSIIEVPSALFDMLPFLMTAVVLVATSMRKTKKLHIPEQLGVNYFREDR